MSPDQIIELELKYCQLKSKVTKMLSAQKDYFRTRDKQKLVIAKKLESEVTEMINPKEKAQKALFEWMAQ